MSVQESQVGLYDTAPPAPQGGGRLKAFLKAGLTSLSSAVLLPVIRRVAGDRIGGETLDEAWAVVRRLEASGCRHSLGFWDTPAYTIDDIVGIYLAAIARVRGSGGYVSIKPPALRFDPAIARRLAVAAREANVRLHCDSHGINAADLTLAFVDELLRELPPRLVSATVPGRWARSLDDADRIMTRGAGVRVVKGEWPDPADPARDLRIGFLQVIDRVKPRKGAVAVASHDPGLVAEALRRLQEGPGHYALEFIHGLQSPKLLDLAKAADLVPTIYVPFGKGFVPSALRVLRRNPSLAMDVLRRMVLRPA